MKHNVLYEGIPLAIIALEIRPRGLLVNELTFHTFISFVLLQCLTVNIRVHVYSNDMPLVSFLLKTV